MSFPLESELSGAVDTALPVDARDRIDLIRSLVFAGQPQLGAQFDVLDDGSYVTVTAVLEDEDEQLLERVSELGGDVRYLDRDGHPMLEVRFYRDGRNDREDVVVGPDDPWPEGMRLAVDLGGEDLSPGQFHVLLQRLAHAINEGREAYLVNVPAYLRLYHELARLAIPLPPREPVGPLYPEVLDELWG